jgi:hypothetical protein
MKSRVLLTTVAFLLVGVLARGQDPTVRAPDSSPPFRIPQANIEQGQPLPPPVPMAAPGCSSCAAPVAEGDGWGQAGRLWVKGEYLRWFLKGSPLPPLVTTSPAGTARASAGVLGMNGTATVVGDTDVNDESRSGGRFTFGFWFDHERTVGIEASYLVVEGQSTQFNAGSDGTQILARPFFDTNANQLAADLIAFPGVLSGSIVVRESSSGLTGAEVDFREEVCHGACYRIDVLGGYRYLRETEHLNIAESLTALDATNRFAAPAGSNILVTDDFVAKNEFHGGNFGLAADLWWNQWTLGLLAKAAVGYNHQIVDINGSSQVTAPGTAPTTSAGGLLAGQFNSGHHDRWVVPVIPEFGVNLAYQFTPHLRVFVGYTFLFWGDVVRAGDQIDFSVNPLGLPPATGTVTGAQRPAFLSSTRDLWVQGINFGGEWKY